MKVGALTCSVLGSKQHIFTRMDLMPEPNRKPAVGSENIHTRLLEDMNTCIAEWKRGQGGECAPGGPLCHLCACCPS